MPPMWPKPGVQHSVLTGGYRCNAAIRLSPPRGCIASDAVCGLLLLFRERISPGPYELPPSGDRSSRTYQLCA